LVSISESFKPTNELTPEQESILEKNLVWVFASPRSGTTWIARELLSYNTHTMSEPYIGAHLAGPFGAQVETQKETGVKVTFKLKEQHKKRPDYFFSEKFKESWKYYTRKTILNRINFQYNDLSRKIIIKEPNGSMGVDIIMDCLPTSKLIVILRDGRDIIDSIIDGRTGEGWMTKNRPAIEERARFPFMISYSKEWVGRMSLIMETYDKHPEDIRYLVKYEDLRTNTVEELGKIYKFLGIEIEKEEIEKIVEKYSFENIPAEKKGKGKPKRSASPGKWKENLPEKEQSVIQDIMGNMLLKLGYE